MNYLDVKVLSLKQITTSQWRSKSVRREFPKGRMSQIRSHKFQPKQMRGQTGAAGGPMISYEVRKESDEVTWTADEVKQS